MKTFTITAIQRKADRIKDGHLYLEDCIALSSEWNEAANVAIFTDDALAEIRQTWTPKPTTGRTGKPCKTCGGL